MTTQSELMARIAGLLGGHAAEELGMGEFTVGATSDLQRATELCRRMVTQFGMSDKIGPVYLGGDQEVFVGKEYGQRANYSEEVAARIDEEVRRLLDEGYTMAKTAIEEHRERFDQLVEALITRDTVSRKEFLALMETGEIPEGLDDDKPQSTPDIPPMEEKKAEEKPAFGEISLDEPSGFKPPWIHDEPEEEQETFTEGKND